MELRPQVGKRWYLHHWLWLFVHKGVSESQQHGVVAGHAASSNPAEGQLPRHSRLILKDTPEERHALVEDAMLMSTWYNEAVVCMPGTVVQHGYPDEWDMVTAFVTAFFAAFGILVGTDR